MVLGLNTRLQKFGLHIVIIYVNKQEESKEIGLKYYWGNSEVTTEAQL